MEITLEKIELVKDRTGVTYREAKAALEGAEGNVVDAIIAIEETIDSKASKSVGSKGEDLIAKMKEIVKKGNVSKVQVIKDDEVLINIPLNVGILGTVVAPWAMIAGLVAAFGFKCKIHFIKDDGSTVDVSEKAGTLYEEAKTKGSEIYDTIQEKAPDVYESVKDLGENAYNKAKEAAGKIKNTKSEDDFEENLASVKEEIDNLEDEVLAEEDVEKAVASALSKEEDVSSEDKKEDKA